MWRIPEQGEQPRPLRYDRQPQVIAPQKKWTREEACSTAGLICRICQIRKIRVLRQASVGPANARNARLGPPALQPWIDARPDAKRTIGNDRRPPAAGSGTTGVNLAFDPRSVAPPPPPADEARPTPSRRRSAPRGPPRTGSRARNRGRRSAGHRHSSARRPG